MNPNLTKEICFNSILSTVGKNKGVSCGYFNVTVYFTDNTQENKERCFLFNDDILKNKNIGLITKMEISDSAWRVAWSFIF